MKMITGGWCALSSHLQRTDTPSTPYRRARACHPSRSRTLRLPSPSWCPREYSLCLERALRRRNSASCRPFVLWQPRSLPRRTLSSRFDLDRDASLIDKKAGFMDAVNPDLSAFRARGGKLLIFHGWNDGGSGGAISPQNTVNYYSSVLAKMGSQQQEWLRLFMVPGMEHCGGGPGPDQVNWMARKSVGASLESHPID